MLLPKPRPRHLVKKDQKAHRKAVIRAVRDVVRQRDLTCRVCGNVPAQGRLEMHEIRSRAQLRGKAPEIIFSTTNCLMLCSAHHRDVTERRLWLRPATDAGADGVIQVEARED